MIVYDNDWYKWTYQWRSRWVNGELGKLSDNCPVRGADYGVDWGYVWTEPTRIDRSTGVYIV